MAPSTMAKTYQEQLEVVSELEAELQCDREAYAEANRGLESIKKRIKRQRNVLNDPKASNVAVANAGLQCNKESRNQTTAENSLKRCESAKDAQEQKTNAAKTELRRLGIAEGIIADREVAPVSKSSKATKNPNRAAKTQTPQASSEPKGSGKRKAPATEGLDDAPKKKAKTSKTAAPRSALQEKSTNDNVTAPRERGRAATQEKTRKRAASSSPSPGPAQKRRGRLVQGLKNRKPVPEPKCASSAAKDTGETSTIPSAKTTSGAASTNKGTKRTAAFSVGDAVPPQAKVAKLLSKKPEAKRSSELGAGAATKETSDSKSTESSTGGTSAGDITSTTTSTTPPSSVDANVAGTPSVAGVQKQEQSPKGIRNIGGSCFSAAVIQLLDTALDGCDLDRFLGAPTNIHDPRLLNDEQCKKIETEISSLPVGKRKVVERMRYAIKNLVISKAREKVSVASHLRHVLEKLHADDGETDISTLVFQSIVAGSKPLWEYINGDTQQDASQYFDMMLEALEEDLKGRKLPNKRSLSRRFQMQTRTSFECPDEQCGYKRELAAGARDDIINQHNVPIPEGSQGSSFLELLTKSMESETDMDCKSCGKTKLVASTGLINEPDNFVVRLGRSRAGVQYQKKGKAADLIDLSHQIIEFDRPGMKYALSAAIMHKGESAEKGHYITFRKNGDNWYKIDDSLVKQVAAKEVTDTAKFQSAMLLFKKQA